MRPALIEMMARAEASGFSSDSSVRSICNHIEAKLEDILIQQLVCNQGRLLATFITRTPTGKSNKYRMLCVSDPQYQGMQLLAGVHRFNFLPLAVPSKPKQTMVHKLMEADAGIQYAEFYEGVMREGVDDKSFFIIGSEVLTAPSHFLHRRQDGEFECFRGFSEVCSRRGWRLLSIWDYN